jgi:hypothetical protein
MKKNAFKGKNNFGFLVPSIPRELWEKIEIGKVYSYHRTLISLSGKTGLYLDRLKRSDLESSMGPPLPRRSHDSGRDGFGRRGRVRK